MGNDMSNLELEKRIEELEKRIGNKDSIKIRE